MNLFGRKAKPVEESADSDIFNKETEGLSQGQIVRKRFVRHRGAASCGNTCTDNEVSQVRTKYIAGDVSLGVGVVALALATYLVLSEKPAAAKASLSLSPAVLF